MKEGGVVVVEGQKCLIEEIVGCKKFKQLYEYEVLFKVFSLLENIWFLCDEFIKCGFEKKVFEVDICEVQCFGFFCLFVCCEIEKYFVDFGFEFEFVLYNLMCGFFGGQKVKVVFGVVMW